MSLFTLKKFISQEDFADAHEPLNDGVKEVPNAQTVAASTKTSDVGTDTNTQGPARVIPEKEDTDDKTEKQFDTVSESAEKGAPKSDSKGSTGEQSTEEPGVGPEPKGNPVKPTPPKADTAKPDEGSEDTEKDSTDAGTKAPPFVKKEAAEESEAKLEHETPEANEDEIKKTEKATKALEAFVPHASRFDLVGYPRKDQDQVRNTISFLRRRSGKDATVSKLSLESISEAVELGKARLELLRGQAEIHTARKTALENYDAVVEQAITAEPTEHGSEPLPAAAAAELTAIETDPLDIPNVVEIERLQESIQTLQAGQAALEQHLTILRSNKRISKQAAAVLQAGLEHIDQTCGLKVRATGLEGYVATPRAALEDADVNEKSLLDRADEIGAKIIKVLKQLLAQAKMYWAKLSSGTAQLLTKIEELQRNAAAAKGTPTSDKINIKSVRGDMFLDGEFVGDHVTTEEADLVRAMFNNANFIRKEGVGPLVAALRNGRDDSEHIFNALQGAGDDTLKLPGGHSVERKGIAMHWVQGSDQPPQGQVEIELPGLGVVKSRIAGLKKYVETLHSDATIKRLEANNEEIMNAVINYRKDGKSHSMDVAQFQSLQSEIIKNVIEPFKPEDYLDIVKHLIQMTSGRVVVLSHMVSSYK